MANQRLTVPRDEDQRLVVVGLCLCLGSELVVIGVVLVIVIGGISIGSFSLTAARKASRLLTDGSAVSVCGELVSHATRQRNSMQ